MIYNTVEAASLWLLVGEVQKVLDDGYIPCGGPILTDRGTYAQAVIKRVTKVEKKSWE